MPESDIRKLVKLGFPKLKIAGLSVFIEQTEDGYTLASVLNRILDILAFNSTVPATLIESTRSALVHLEVSDLYRDSVRGLFYKLLHAIAGLGNVIGISQQIQTAMAHDVTLRMLFLNKSAAEKEQQELRASERETLKERLRRMDDTRRELTKLYLDMGISAHIVTPEDRELFLQHRQAATATQQPNMEEAVDPEADPSSVRDYVDNGDVPVTDTGVELGVDYGDYGDRAAREEYETIGGIIDDEEGYGT